MSNFMIAFNFVLSTFGSLFGWVMAIQLAPGITFGAIFVAMLLMTFLMAYVVSVPGGESSRDQGERARYRRWSNDKFSKEQWEMVYKKDHKK